MTIIHDEFPNPLIECNTGDTISITCKWLTPETITYISFEVSTYTGNHRQMARLLILVIPVSNQVDASVEIHWHGLHLEGPEACWMDSAAEGPNALSPQAQRRPTNSESKTLLALKICNPHTALKDGKGFLGPIIVYNKEESSRKSMYTSDRVVIFRDNYHAHQLLLITSNLSLIM